MEKIKMPKEIDTPEKFLNWVRSYKENPSTDIEFHLKRSGYNGYAFSEHRGKIHYLKSDGVGSGLIMATSINRVFNIYVW